MLGLDRPERRRRPSLGRNNADGERRGPAHSRCAGAVNPLPAAMRVADDGGDGHHRRADMFMADGRPSDDDPRENRRRLGDERTTLTESCAASASHWN